MLSPHVESLMAQFAHEGLTFDDVSLVTQYADFQPHEASITSQFSRNIQLHTPFVSAAMDTVTEADMAIAMALAGGIGVVHKNLTEEKQADEVRRVKTYLNGLIENPVCFRDSMTIEELLTEKSARKFKFTGFPILDDSGKLVGILTARDVKFVTDSSILVRDVMTTELITAPVGTSLEDAFRIMMRDRVGKLPLMKNDGTLAGLYSFHDVKSLIENDEPNVTRDEHFRLRVAAAISPNDFQRADLLAKAGVDALVVDTAHGFTKGVIDTVKALKSTYQAVDIIAGNVASSDAARALLEAGADAIKVGVGPGSICTTRVVCGVGVPQLSAVHDVYTGISGEIPVIADGGIKYSGYVPKAMAVGASVVMMGSALAGTQESPGEKILHQGRTYVVYRGMGSMEAMEKGKGSRERYGQGDVNDTSKLVPQGIEGLVQYRGTVNDVLTQFAGGLRFSLGYCGAKDLSALRATARLVRITSAGLREAHPHDVRIVKDAPNYSPGE